MSGTTAGQFARKTDAETGKILAEAPKLQAETGKMIRKQKPQSTKQLPKHKKSKRKQDGIHLA
jgi:hypothetical protein